MSFDDEKIQFLRDIGLTQESVQGEQNLRIMAEYQHLRDMIESTIARELQLFGFSGKAAIAFSYDDPELVATMHRLLHRRYEGIEEDLVKEMGVSYKTAVANEDIDPVAFVEEVLLHHYLDLKEAVDWVSSHTFTDGQKIDEEMNRFCYNFVNEVEHDAQALGDRLRLPRKKNTPAFADLPEAKTVTATQETRPARSEAPRKTGGTTFASHRAQFLRDMGVTPEAFGGDFHDYEAIARSPDLKEIVETIIADNLSTLGYKADERSLTFTYRDAEFVGAMHRLLSCVQRGRPDAYEQDMLRARTDYYGERDADHQPSDKTLIRTFINDYFATFHDLVMQAAAIRPKDTLSEEETQTLVAAHQALDAAEVIAKRSKLPFKPVRTEETRAPLAQRMRALLDTPQVCAAIGPLLANNSRERAA